jgi:20S proteasome subunit alpha 7
LETLTVKEALKEAARIIYLVHDDVKDKDFELELSWISVEGTQGRHERVPRDVLEEAETWAKASTQDEMEED